MTILVTGGAGFIGSALIRHILDSSSMKVVNLDKLTYAGNLESLELIEDNPNYTFEQADICNSLAVQDIFEKHQPKIVMHLAAESHVDRSIDGPSIFLQTNIMGTFNLLEQSRIHISNLSEFDKRNFRFHHISTDEVYGDVLNNKRSDEYYTYNPSSPYSASKASSDHLIKSYIRTYKINAVISNCCNNYGPYQFPEKLIPKMISNIMSNNKLPLYAKGRNSREWIHVEDHCRALLMLYLKGKSGESYNVGSNANLRNIDLVKKILKLCKFNKVTIGNKTKIMFVKDRPGHDFRYALNSKKIFKKLKWKTKINLNDGLLETIKWYLSNKKFLSAISKKDYKNRLGLKL